MFCGDEFPRSVALCGKLRVIREQEELSGEELAVFIMACYGRRELLVQMT
jgi:hypothetical protein